MSDKIVVDIGYYELISVMTSDAIKLDTHKGSFRICYIHHEKEAII